MEHRNQEDYMITDRNGRTKRADLIDYINEIKGKRNLVYAKLCLKSDEINEAVCREVIGYLEDVIKTRGVEQD